MIARDHRTMQFIRRQAIDTPKAYNSKIAAGIAIKGQVISTGRNSNRTHPFQARFGKHEEAIYLHAETAAISNALNHVHKDDLRKATLFVHRVKMQRSESTEWSDGMAKPCSGCMAAIAAFGIKRVIYSTEERGEYRIIDMMAEAV